MDYTSRDQLGCNNSNNGDARNDNNKENDDATKTPVVPDLHRQLLTATAATAAVSSSSQDSHNDSGYSTRMGFSAGPSPSLSGKKKLTCCNS